MEFEKQKFFDDCCRGENRHIPKWARDEHLEMNVPQKKLWSYSEDGPKASAPKMTGLYRLIVVLLFAGATFLIADDCFFLGIVVFLTASWMLGIGDSNTDGRETGTNEKPTVNMRRKRKKRRVAVNTGRAHCS